MGDDRLMITDERLQITDGCSMDCPLLWKGTGPARMTRSNWGEVKTGKSRNKFGITNIKEACCT